MKSISRVKTIIRVCFADRYDKDLDENNNMLLHKTVLIKSLHSELVIKFLVRIRVETIFLQKFWTNFNAIFLLHSNISKLAVFWYYRTQNWMLKMYVLRLKMYILRLKIYIFTINMRSVIIIVIKFWITNSSQNNSIWMWHFWYIWKYWNWPCFVVRKTQNYETVCPSQGLSSHSPLIVKNYYEISLHSFLIKTFL